MLRFARWKVASIIGMTLCALLIIAPSFLSKQSFDAVRAALQRWVVARRSASVREQPDGFELTSCESAFVLPEATRLPVSFLAHRTDALAIVARDHLLPASGFACFLHTFVGAFDLEKLKPGAGGHDAAVQLAPSVAASCNA